MTAHSQGNLSKAIGLPTKLDQFYRNALTMKDFFRNLGSKRSDSGRRFRNMEELQEVVEVFFLFWTGGS